MQNSNNVIEICNPNKVWNLEEANSIIPVLQYISNKCNTRIEELLAHQRQIIRSTNNRSQIEAIDSAVVEELKRYGRKIIKLGCKYDKGYVMFPTESGKFYSWLPKEEVIQYWSSWHPLFMTWERYPLKSL